MNRVVLSLFAVLLATGVVLGNAAPPRTLPTEHRIVTEKDYPEFNFYLLSGAGKNQKLTAVKFDSKTPIQIAAPKTQDRDYFLLVAVPKDAASGFADENELRQAVAAKKIEGMVQTKSQLPTFVIVARSDKRESLVQEHKIEKINAKDGIVLVTKDVEPKKDDKKKDSPDEDDAPGVSAYTPRGGMLVASLAASLAVMLGGFWLVGRGRRKV